MMDNVWCVRARRQSRIRRYVLLLLGLRKSPFVKSLVSVFLAPTNDLVLCCPSCPSTYNSLLPSVEIPPWPVRHTEQRKNATPCRQLTARGGGSLPSSTAAA